jgi:uncharacterized protein (DUF2132 family)
MRWLNPLQAWVLRDTLRSMQEHHKNHPLNGIKLPDLVQQLVDFYGWEVLAAQININCFKSNPSVDSSVKFLRKTEWARHRLEAFYLYRYRQFPLPTEAEHALPPRERAVDIAVGDKPPMVLTVDDGEFFDDPDSGWAPRNQPRKQNSKPAARRTSSHASTGTRSSGGPVDPWSKWRSKQTND